MTRIGDEIDAFVGEWENTVFFANDAFVKRDFKAIANLITLEKAQHPHNHINRKGYDHLVTAAEILLSQENLTQKISIDTAINTIVQSFFTHFPDAIKVGVFSDTKISEGARARLKTVPTNNGIYVFPLLFAPLARRTNLQIGPVHILSKRKFVSKYKAALKTQKHSASGSFLAQLYEDWAAHVRGYDHFALVELHGYEAKMAWDVGREAVEFVLNLIRMLFGFYHTDDIRIGGGFVWEVKRSSLRFTQIGEASISSSRGPWGTHLGNNWTSIFSSRLGYFMPLIVGFLILLLGGNAHRSPVVERLRYASRLLAEAYSEPHDHVRLVRAISALESLALVEGHDKAHQLGLRCAEAGGCGDCGLAVTIYDDIRNAYYWRSAVVHGDASSPGVARQAFMRLERHALDIVLGFLLLYECIQRESAPQSVGVLRRAVKARIDMFFWNPTVAGALL